MGSVPCRLTKDWAQSMDLLYFALNPLDTIHSLTVSIAIFLFLAFYIALNIVQARRVTVPQPVRLPAWLFWLTPAYPSWLDKLTFSHTVRAFVQALVIAIILWIVLMIVLAVVLVKAYSP